MALSLPITLVTGLSAPAAYARISSVTMTHIELTANVQVWASADARLALVPTIHDLSFSLPYNAAPTLASVYQALKTQESFVGSLDV